MGTRQSIYHNSPHYKINEGFNFWHDVKTNIMARNNWEGSGTVTEL